MARKKPINHSRQKAKNPTEVVELVQTSRSGFRLNSNFVHGGTLFTKDVMSGEASTYSKEVLQTSLDVQPLTLEHQHEDEVVFIGKDPKARDLALQARANGDMDWNLAMPGQLPMALAVGVESQDDDCAYGHADDDIDARVDAHVGVHVDVHVDAHIDAHVDAHIDAHVDAHIDAHVDVHDDFHADNHAEHRNDSEDPRSCVLQALEPASSSASSTEDSVVEDYVQNILTNMLQDSDQTLNRFAHRTLGLDMEPGFSFGKNTNESTKRSIIDSSTAHDLTDAELMSAMDKWVQDRLEDDLSSDSSSKAVPRGPKHKRKKKGAARPMPVVSDDELQSQLSTAWNNDRLKKQARRAERDQLRAQGLLGQKSATQEKMSNGDATSTGTRLSSKYKTGMTVVDLGQELATFCRSGQSELALPPLDAGVRKLLHMIAHQLGLKSKSHGSGNTRYLVLYKSAKVRGFDHSVWDKAARKIRRPFLFRTDVGLTTPSRSSRRVTSGTQKDTIRPHNRGPTRQVGQDAPELGTTKSSLKAKAMMEKMGWAKGQGLGSVDNKGILTPIEQIIRQSRAGLG